MINSLIVLLSEAALALYPILIKTVPVNLSTQLLARFLTFTFMGTLLARPGTLSSLWSGIHAIRSSFLGSITLAHVGTSYYAFEKLPAGVAMSLFYTYPVWNLLGGYIGYGETISFFQFLLICVSLVGVIFLAIGTQDTEESGELGKREIEWKGVFSGLAAAFTETCMYFAVRTAEQIDPYFSTVELYSGALLGMLGFLGFGAIGGSESYQKVSQISTSGNAWLKMLMFNIAIGFVGYAMRFYAIPKMSTIAFSLLSLVGVVASFFWGWIFVGEKPNALSISGAALVCSAAAFLDKMD